MPSLAIAAVSVFLIFCANGSPIVFRDEKGSEPHWSYQDTDAWSKLFPTCGGNRQSPININTTSAVNAMTYPLKFANYNVLTRNIVASFGHNVDFTWRSNEMQYRPGIIGGGLNDKYLFHSLHFHWGNDSRRGSEHQINSERFPAEIHLVHYNSKYGDLENAKKKEDGLAVLAVFIRVSGWDNKALDPIINQFNIISHRPGSRSQLFHPIALDFLLPADTRSFYRYSGSLTTPACNQVVTWIVFPTPITLSEYQLSIMRQVTANNFRPPQQLNMRQITFFY